ncbi:MAG: hypothetical protein PHS84_14830, partial [Paludibacter sp.]|nr:hypothetical protein [Paludibacter sp.]
MNLQNISLSVGGSYTLNYANLYLSGKNFSIGGNFAVNGGSLVLGGANLTIGGDYTVNTNFDLGGSTLTIKHNLYQTNGTVNINHGTLHVDGNYTLEAPYTGYYTYRNIVLQMTNQNDYVFVGGNFTYQTDVESDYNLTAGTLEIQGNFTQYCGRTWKYDPRYGDDGTYYSGYYLSTFDTFRPNGTHRVVLSGSGTQNINLCSYDGSSYFNILEIRNNSGIISSGNLSFNSLEGDASKLYAYSLLFKKPLSSDIHISGDCNLHYGTLDLNGHTLTVGGNLQQNHGSVRINGGKLIVFGNYSIISYGQSR